MFDFKCFTPTKVIFGRNTESEVGRLVQAFGGTKVLIHYGGGSVVRSGLLRRVTDALEETGIPYVTLGGAIRGFPAGSHDDSVRHEQRRADEGQSENLLPL